MKRLLIFDDDGDYIDEEIVPSGTIPKDSEYLASLDENISFHRLKLVNGELVEGKTADEILEDQLISSLIPSKQELEDAEFEIRAITLLSELEVIL